MISKLLSKAFYVSWIGAGVAGCSAQAAFHAGNGAPPDQSSTATPPVAEADASSVREAAERPSPDFIVFETGMINPAKQVGKKVRACFSYDKVKIRGHGCDRAIFDVAIFGESAGRQINLNNGSRPDVGGSREGGIFPSVWDASGTFKVSTKCALAGGCHRDVAFLSIIGEVEDTKGNKKWLKIEQGKITPDKEYSYKFSEFELLDKEVDFTTLCAIAVK